MENNQFYAMLSRMKYVNRWGTMRNTSNENICEHSLNVAFIAHALGIINNEEFNGNIDAQRLAVLGMYHDVTEMIREAYADVERVAKDELLSGIPEKMRKYYDSVLLETEEENELWKYVKAADKLSALIKCLEEEQMGNSDFADAKLTIEEYLKNMNMKEVDFFMEKFLPAYSMTLDESVTRLEG